MTFRIFWSFNLLSIGDLHLTTNGSQAQSYNQYEEMKLFEIV